MLPVFIGRRDRLRARRTRSAGASPPWTGFRHVASLCIALFVCTGMIYACIRFLQEWASPLTLVNFVLLGGASGATLAAALAAWLAPAVTALYAKAAIALTLAGARDASARLARAQRAGCVRSPRCRPRSASSTRGSCRRRKGFMGGSFNTREFFHGASPAKLRVDQVGIPAAGLSPCRCCCCSRDRERRQRAAYGACVRRAVRRTPGRALVLLRAGQSPAEPLLPGDFLNQLRRRAHDDLVRTVAFGEPSERHHDVAYRAADHVPMVGVGAIAEHAVDRRRSRRDTRPRRAGTRACTAGPPARTPGTWSWCRRIRGCRARRNVNRRAQAECRSGRLPRCPPARLV